MATGRLAFLIKYKRKVPGGTATDEYRTTGTCIPRVAEFLDITSKQFTPSVNDVVDRAAYSREYTKADGSVGSVDVAQGKISYAPKAKARAKKVFLTTGKKTAKGTPKKISFTFPKFLTVAEIGDALGELIPDSKIDRTGAVSATNIAPFFTLEGGGTYPIPTSTIATGTANPDVATSEDEQTSILAGTKSKPKKKPVASPTPS